MQENPKFTNVYAALLVRALAAVCVTLTGCGGASLLREPQPFESHKPLAEAKDERVSASIENAILRNGAGSWARDADWDEYLIRLRAISDEPVEIRQIAIFDALDQRIESRSNRSDLVAGTREIERRYEQSGQLVRVRGGSGWAAAGAGVTGVAGIAILTAPAGFAGMATVAGSLAVITGVGVVYAGAGVMRLVANAEVNAEIQRRQTTLPLTLARGVDANVDLFFPLTPLSGRTQVVYVDRFGEHRLNLDTRQALIDLDPSPVLITRFDPRFPDHVRRTGVNKGHVIARLTIDSQGHVQGVDVTESVPLRVFDDEARRTFHRWIFTRSRHDERTVDARLDFTR